MVNRELIKSDLDQITSNVWPLIESQAESAVETLAAMAEEAVLSAPYPLGLLRPAMAQLARRLVADQASRLPMESLAPAVSAALARVLLLSDEDLLTLCSWIAETADAYAGTVDPASLTGREAKLREVLSRLAALYV